MVFSIWSTPINRKLFCPINSGGDQSNFFEVRIFTKIKAETPVKY